MFDKKVRRGTLTLPKAHSFGFGVRVQDRLHQDILTVQDRCLMTIRDEEYTLGEHDLDAMVLEGLLGYDSKGRHIFRFSLQASDLNLDPVKKWFYALSFVRDGYSVLLAQGRLVIDGNPTNRTAASVFDTVDASEMVYRLVDSSVVNVVSTIPMPAKGDPGEPGADSDVPGPKGDKGDKGDTGANGLSAYQVAVSQGYVGSESDWLGSLKGDPGDLAAGAYLVPDPTHPGLYLPTAGSAMVEDPAHDGLYTIGPLV